MFLHHVQNSVYISYLYIYIAPVHVPRILDCDPPLLKTENTVYPSTSNKQGPAVFSPLGHSCRRGSGRVNRSSGRCGLRCRTPARTEGGSRRIWGIFMQSCAHFPLEKHLYYTPWRLTWNLKISPWKRRFLLETIIMRFHVKLWGCMTSGGLIMKDC